MTASHALSQLSYGPNKKTLKTVGKQEYRGVQMSVKGAYSFRVSEAIFFAAPS
jgi:hypothetical protein